MKLVYAITMSTTIFGDMGLYGICMPTGLDDILDGMIGTRY
jgi:hypothetical protein